jgi:putative transposase
MTLRDLLEKYVGVDGQDIWENERTPTPMRCFAVQLHSMGLSVRGIEGVLARLGVDRCYQAVRNWKEKLPETQSDLPTAEPSRVAVDQREIEVDGEKSGSTPRLT